MRVGLGADVHGALALKPEAQTSSKRFYGKLGLVGYSAPKEHSELGGVRGTLPAYE